MTVSDRIAVMHQGQLVQVATPAQLYEYPASRYVADFIGDVNLIEGRIAATHEDEVTLESGQLPSPVMVLQPDVDAGPGDTAWLALRPEKTRISLDPPDDRSANCVQGEVWDIGYLGDLSIYRVRLEDGHIMKATVTNQTRLVQRPITWEDKVWLSWSRDGGVILTK